MPDTPEDVVKETRAMLTQASRIHALSDSDPSKDVDVGWMLASLCDEVERLQGQYDSAVSDFAAEINRVNQQLSEVTKERDDLLDKLAEEVAKRVNKSVASMEDDRLTDTQRGSFD